jgi:phage terminase large subunit
LGLAAWPGAKGELIAGSTIVATAESLLGRKRVEVLPRVSPEDGINAARLLLPRCWFDAHKCRDGLKALRQYRRQYNEDRKVFSDKPYHDWTSHAADAFRYLAMGIKDSRDDVGDAELLKGFGTGSGRRGGWMA